MKSVVNKFSTKRVLSFYLILMGGVFLFGILFPDTLSAWVNHPEFYVHLKFAHIFAVTLFFANTIIGTIWETRSLLSKDAAVIRYTYQTVVWLDAFLIAPLILISVLTGIAMGTALGGVWSTGWIGSAFILFLCSGLVWVTLDIPTQYKVNRLFETLDPASSQLPPRLIRLLWFRTAVSAMGTLPLLVIFFLMVHKPDLPKLTNWFAPFQAGSLFLGGIR